ncbi:hypothetical protein [Coprobacter sp.]
MTRENKPWIIATVILALLLILIAGLFWLRYSNERTTFEIVDDLGGNIFPSAILSVAVADTQIVVPADTLYLGNPKSGIAIHIKSGKANSKVRVTIATTPFFEESVSEFILEKPKTEYRIYPDIIWKYEALKQSIQPSPVSVSIQVELNHKKMGQRIKTMSVRSINECLLGYIDEKQKFHDTGIFFAAYVNEDHPMIDLILREALNTRIVNRFLGYQYQGKYVEKQVYAIWNALQKRNLKYSSVSSSSLSSNVVFSQRVRLFEDVLESAQINCVDGSVLFASLLKAINIDPILVRMPGHMFVGYYLDKSHTRKDFLETTMIGDVNLDDFFPEEQLDSTMIGKSQNEISRTIFNKSKEYANKRYIENKSSIETKKKFYTLLEISRNIRKNIQPIGK